MIYFNKSYINKTDINQVVKVCKSKKLARNNLSLNLSKFLKNKLKSNYIGLTQSGSDALEVAMHLLKLKSTDEVILPSYTFSATANSIILANGKPVFADIKKDDLCIDLDDAEKLINKNTKAICLVHYGGNSCDLKKAKYLQRKYNIRIIEDAAHALFSKYKNKYCGTIGDIGIFSFHYTKNFTSAQGGAISINNKKFIDRGKDIINKGNSKKLTKKNYYYWVDKGSEYEMSGLSAALLINQVLKFKVTQNKRLKIFNKYKNELLKKKFQNIFQMVVQNKYSKHSYHLFAIIFRKNILKKRFIKFMKKKKIQTVGHYFPLHLSPYGRLFKKSTCKVTEKIYDNIVRLPIYPDLQTH